LTIQQRPEAVMPRSYPPEFRRRVLELVASGRKVAEVAQLLGISDQTIYNWRRQHLIATGRLPGTTSSDNAEPVAARKRIAESEAELPSTARPRKSSERRPPKKRRRFEAIRVTAAEHLPVKLACRVLHAAESGYYAWCNFDDQHAVRLAELLGNVCLDVVTDLHALQRARFSWFWSP
jgi:transposase-like protein